MTLLKVFVLSVTVMTIASATPPPGYVKKPDNDKDPPKYEYAYDVADGVGGRQGHLESRDGIYAKGMYYVTVPGSGQRVEYFADDWGYHPLVSYNTNTKSSSSTAQLAFGEKAVHALHQSAGGISASQSIASQFPSRGQKVSTVLTPVSNHLRQGPVSTSSYSLNQGQGALIINHQANNGGYSSESAQSYQEGGQANYQQNTVSNQAFQTTVTAHTPLQLRQQQRLTAKLQVVPNVPQAGYISGNSINQISSAGIASNYLVQGSSAQSAIDAAVSNAANQGHQQYHVEVNAGRGSYHSGSGASQQLHGTTQLVAVQQPQQLTQTIVAGSETHGGESASTSTSYSSQTSGQLEYGSKLTSSLSTGANAFSSSYAQNAQEGTEIIGEQEQVISVTPAPLQHTSLQPIVVEEYQKQPDVHVVTPTSNCNCPSTTPSSVFINSEGSSPSYQASTSGHVSLSSGSSVSNLETNVLNSHVTTKRPLFVQSTTSVPPFYINEALSSSAQAASSSSSLLTSNNGDSGHIDVLPVSSTQQPPLVSSTSYVSSHSTVNSLPLPRPTLPTVVITPKPLPVSEALTSSQELLAPFQAALSLAEYAGSSHNSQLGTEQQSFTKLSVVQPGYKDSYRYKTVVEIQKAIPIEVSQESLNAEDEAQIKENGIPISYIQQIVNTAEQNEQLNQQAINNQVEYGYKLNSVSNFDQSDKSQLQSQVSTSVASEGQIRAQLAAQAEQATEQNIKQQETINESQAQVSVSQQPIIGNQQQQFIGPPQSAQENNQHQATHQYHKQILTHVHQPPRYHYVQRPYQVSYPFNFHVVDEIYPVRQARPIHYGQKVRQRGHRFNHQFFRNQQNTAQLQLNQDFVTKNRNLLQSEEAKQQKQINQASLEANQQLHNADQQLILCDHHTEVAPLQEISINQQTVHQDHQFHAAGHQLNQQLLDEEASKQEDQRVQDSVGANQQLFGIINNQNSEIPQQFGENIAGAVNSNVQQFGGQQEIGQSFGVVANNQPPSVKTIPTSFSNIQSGPQQQINQNVVGVVSNQQSGVAAINVVSKINNQQTPLEQQYNQQLLANTIRKPSSSALAQQAVNTNHQSTLKFVRQPEGEKQAEAEKDYNQQLVEESKQDHIQSDKQVVAQAAPLKLLLDAERHVPGNQEGQSFDGLNQQLQSGQTEFLDSPSQALPLQQVEQGDFASQASLLQTIPLQDSLPLSPSIFNHQTNFLNTLSLQHQFPIEHTKVFPVEPLSVSRPHNIGHTKISELKKPYPVRVDHTRVVNVDRPYPVPHPIPIEVTKLVAVDRPWPYPQPYPVPHPVAVPYAVPHPVQVPVNHYIHYPHVVRVPFKGYQPNFFNGNRVVHRPLMPPNPRFQKQAAHAYFKSHYSYGGGAQNFNTRPQFSYKNKFVGPTQQLKSGQSLTHNQQQQLLARHQPKALNIEYGFKPPLIPSLQIAVDPEPEPEPFVG